jgi:AcrR family transcriptional regulator
MQEIADDCGMSAANLYRYFEGKLAIAVEVARTEQTTQLHKCDEAVLAAPADVASRLIALFHAIIDTSRRQMKQTPLLFQLSLDVSRETPSLRRNLLDEIEARTVAPAISLSAV